MITLRGDYMESAPKVSYIASNNSCTKYRVPEVSHIKRKINFQLLKKDDDFGQLSNKRWVANVTLLPYLNT